MKWVQYFLSKKQTVTANEHESHDMPQNKTDIYYTTENQIHVSQHQVTQYAEDNNCIILHQGEELTSSLVLIQENVNNHIEL